MKWLFILLLIANVAYLGWEIDRGAKIERASLRNSIIIPPGTKQLALIAELDQKPASRQAMLSDADQSNPVLPIELNPNTEKMIDTLLADSSMMQIDNSVLQQTFAEPGEDTFEEQQQQVVCYTYGPIPDSNESELMSSWLDNRAIKYTERLTTEDGKQLFWVYLAPQKSRQDAEAAMRDLKQQGVNDLRLINTGDLLNAVSLGVFSSQASVNRRLNEIKAKGYQPVVVPYSNGKQIRWFDVMIVQNSTYVNDLFTGFPARFNAVPVACNEIAMASGNP